MEHESFGLTDPGVAREENQDVILRDPELGLYIVCDGCGGQLAGATASQYAIQTTHAAITKNFKVLESYAQQPTRRRRLKAVDTIADAVNAASAAIHTASLSDMAKAGMGSTIVLLAVVGDQAICAHAGDSRLYLYRRGQLHQLTEDHNLANRYVRMGLISKDQASKTRSAKMITRVLGRHEEAHADTLHFELVPEDMILLCSDGLTLHLDDKEIALVLKKVPPQRICEKLIEVANKRGGEDNVSAVLVQAAGQTEKAGDDVVRRLAALQRVPLFRHLSFQELLRVMDITELESYDAGGRIVAEGEVSDRLFVSVDGTVRVSKGQVALAHLPAGSLFGEMGLIDEHRRSADILAEQATRLLVIRRQDFFSLLKRERSLAVKVLWGLCSLLTDRLRSTSERLSGQSVGHAVEPAGAEPKSKLAELADAIRPFV